MWCHSWLAGKKKQKKQVSAEVQDSYFETVGLDRTALPMTPASSTLAGREARIDIG